MKSVGTAVWVALAGQDSFSALRTASEAAKIIEEKNLSMKLLKPQGESRLLSTHRAPEPGMAEGILGPEAAWAAAGRAGMRARRALSGHTSDQQQWQGKHLPRPPGLEGGVKRSCST